MDELFASGTKLTYLPGYSYFLENGEETVASKVQSNQANCLSFEFCHNCTIYQKNVSILLAGISAEKGYGSGQYLAGSLNHCCAG